MNKQIGVLALSTMVALAGCANSDNFSGDVYTAQQAKTVQTVSYGTITATRAVKIQDGEDSVLGTLAGGVLGGISTGQDILVHLAVKPTSSIRLPRRSINLVGEPVVVETHGRHDPCVGIRATPIAEAMLALVLMDHALQHRGQCADVHCQTPKIGSKMG